LYLAKSFGCEREVGRISHELEGFAVLGSVLDALGCRRWAAVQKQRNVKLMKSSEEDGTILQKVQQGRTSIFGASLHVVTVNAAGVFGGSFRANAACDWREKDSKSGVLC